MSRFSNSQPMYRIEITLYKSMATGRKGLMYSCSNAEHFAYNVLQFLPKLTTWYISGSWYGWLMGHKVERSTERTLFRALHLWILWYIYYSLNSCILSGLQGRPVRNLTTPKWLKSFSHILIILTFCKRNPKYFQPGPRADMHHANILNKSC